MTLHRPTVSVSLQSTKATRSKIKELLRTTSYNVDPHQERRIAATFDSAMANTTSTPPSTHQTNQLFPLSKGHIVLALIMCMAIPAVVVCMGIWYHKRDAEEREKLKMLESIVRDRLRTAEAEAVARQVEEDRVRALANLEVSAGEPSSSRR